MLILVKSQFTGAKWLQKFPAPRAEDRSEFGRGGEGVNVFQKIPKVGGGIKISPAAQSTEGALIVYPWNVVFIKILKLF